MSDAARARFRKALPLLIAAWAALLALGMKLQMDYERTPGTAGPARPLWPADSALARSTSFPTLVLFAHPRCPCTRSTLDVLDELRTRGAFRTVVAFVRPDGLSEDWVRGGLWEKAAAIGGVEVREDVDGLEARRFGARTSGHAFLYDGDGRLRFEGGLTPGRGAVGRSAGARAVVAVLRGDVPSHSAASVFGCPLVSEKR